jgi:hypothetical protein
MRMAWLKKLIFFSVEYSHTCHRQKAECEAQMESDGVLPQEHFEYAHISTY